MKTQMHICEIRGGGWELWVRVFYDDNTDRWELVGTYGSRECVKKLNDW